MTTKVRAGLDADVADKFPDNTSGQITATDLRGVLEDMVDTCYRDDALYLEAGDGRLLLETGTGHITQNVPSVAVLPVTSGLIIDLDGETPGVTVDQWDDQSGSGNHWTKQTGKDFPTISGGIATFNGTSTSITGPSLAALTEGEMFLVIKRATAASETGNNTGAWKFGQSGASNHYLFATDLYDDFGGNTRIASFNGGAIDGSEVGVYHVLGIRNDGIASGYVASVNDTEDTAASNTGGGFPTTPYIGRSGPSSTYYLDAEIKRMLFYDRVLSGAERTQVRDYLYEKYGITP